MNKKIREIMTQFDNIETLEQAQLLSLFLTQKKLQEALKLLVVDTTSKKRRFSSIQIDLIENVKQGLRKIGKYSQTKDKSGAKKVMLMFVVNKNMTQNRQISSISSEVGFSTKTMREYVKRRLIVDDNTMEGNWAIMCRAPHSDRIEDLLKI